MDSFIRTGQERAEQENSFSRPASMGNEYPFNEDSSQKEAISRNENEESDAMKSSFDRELEELLAKQKATIKVVGCGGGGNNTINRISEVGITGAETIAINTGTFVE